MGAPITVTDEVTQLSVFAPHKTSKVISAKSNAEIYLLDINSFFFLSLKILYFCDSTKSDL